MIQMLTEYFNWLRRHYMARLLLLSVIVGLLAGLGALVFNTLVNYSVDFFMGYLVGYHMPTPGGEGETVAPGPALVRWMFFLVPAIGGLLAGLTVYWFAPDAGGHGTDSVIECFHREGGKMRKRVPLVKAIASAFTLGSGGSAGREGPITQIGAGIGSVLGSIFHSNDRERRVLGLAGAAAGLGALFRVPLGGALFATEVLYREMDFEVAALVPSFVASITSYSVYCGIQGVWGAVFAVPPLKFNHVAELPVYVALGLLCALAGALYVKTMEFVQHRIFKPLRIPVYVKPAIGGLLVGVLGYFLPQVLGPGYGWLQLAMDGHLPLLLIATVALVKILSTSLTVGSGGSGGTFAPAMVIGGLLGSAVGLVLRDLAPGISPSLPAFALAGMAGFLAGAAKTPLSALIMISEMTTGYGLLVPLMLTVTAGYVLSHRRTSMYHSQVNRQIDSPAHEGEFIVGALERIPVRDALPKDPKLTVFKRSTPLSEILPALANTKQQIFPVLNDDGTLYGVIDFHDIRYFFTEHEIPAVVAQDLLAPTYATVSLNEDLASALRKFRLTRLEELPVMDPDKPVLVKGVLSRRNIIAAYHDRMV
jgi:chloride channel protein, CIC family